MVDLFKPRDQKDVAAAVEWALAGAKTLEIVGGGSKREIGRAAQWDLTLDLSALSGITLYEPEELVLSAKAGTPLAQIEQLVASRDQELAFEPMDCGPVLGRPAGRGTLGGALATNLSGPRRPRRACSFSGSTTARRSPPWRPRSAPLPMCPERRTCRRILPAGSWARLRRAARSPRFGWTACRPRSPSAETRWNGCSSRMG